MAVNSNPYERWQSVRQSADYRSRETQASSLTRQMLSQEEYLLKSNRVNPGPWRNFRAALANASQEIPHNASNEDIWGWQSWVESHEEVLEIGNTAVVFISGIFKEGVFIS